NVDAVEQEVDLDQVGSVVASRLVVQAGVTPRPALELIEEVDHHLGQWYAVHELQALGREVFHLHHLAPAGLAQVHDRPRVLGGGEDGHGEERLFHPIDGGGSGQGTRVVDIDDRAVGQVGPVLDRRSRGDECEVELTLQAFAHDLHVQQAQEPAAE